LFEKKSMSCRKGRKRKGRTRSPRREAFMNKEELPRRKWTVEERKVVPFWTQCPSEKDPGRDFTPKAVTLLCQENRAMTGLRRWGVPLL